MKARWDLNKALIVCVSLVFAGIAGAATNPGSLGDGLPSVVYDEFTGDMIIDPDGLFGITAFEFQSSPPLFDQEPVWPAGTLDSTWNGGLVSWLGVPMGLDPHDLGPFTPSMNKDDLSTTNVLPNIGSLLTSCGSAFYSGSKPENGLGDTVCILRE